MLTRCLFDRILLGVFICNLACASTSPPACEGPTSESSTGEMDAGRYAECLLRHCEDASPVFFSCPSSAGAANCEVQALGDLRLRHLCPAACQTCVLSGYAFEDGSLVAEGQRSETEVSGGFAFSADLAGHVSAAALQPAVLAALASTLGVRPSDLAALAVSVEVLRGAAAALRGSERSSQTMTLSVAYEVLVPTGLWLPDVYRAARELTEPLDSEAYSAFAAALVLHGTDVGVVSVGALVPGGGSVRLSNAPEKSSASAAQAETAGQGGMPQSGLRGSRAAAVAWVALAMVVLGLSAALCTRALKQTRREEGEREAAAATAQRPADDLIGIIPNIAEARSNIASIGAGEMPTLLSAGPAGENAESDAKY